EEAGTEEVTRQDGAARAAAPPPAERWRRMHRLAGAGFLGLFLVVHLATSAAALGGEERYRRVVAAVERWRTLPLLELAIVVPLLSHVGYGLRLLRRPASDPSIERYGDRRWWTAQRISATVVLAFVL